MFPCSFERIRQIQRVIQVLYRCCAGLLIIAVTGQPLEVQSLSLKRESAFDKYAKSKAPFKTIGLKCPSRGSGLMEQYRVNADNLIGRLRYTIRNGDVASYTAQAAEFGGSYVELVSVDVKDVKDIENESNRAGKSLTKEGRALLVRICGDKDNYTRFRQLMNSNLDAYPQWRDSVLFTYN